MQPLNAGFLRPSFMIKFGNFSLLVLGSALRLTGNLRVALKVIHSFRKADFDRFRLIVPHPYERYSEKGQLPLIGSRHVLFIEP